MELLYLYWPRKPDRNQDLPPEGWDPVWRLAAAAMIIAILYAALAAVCALTPPA